jgi:hypothetical protein
VKDQELTMEEFLKDKGVIGYDPRFFTQKFVSQFLEKNKSKGIRIIENLVDLMENE